MTTIFVYDAKGELIAEYGSERAAVPDPLCYVDSLGSTRMDQESGNDFFGARYFSGAQGRFISADRPLADQHTMNPQNWNLYA